MAAALLAGCGGSQSPICAPGAMPQAQLIAKRGSPTYNVLYRFRGKEDSNGYYPAASLIDMNGTLYGTTEFGGNTTGDCAGSNKGCGTVYSVSPSGAEHV